jgi:hypothetical protein
VVWWLINGGAGRVLDEQKRLLHRFEELGLDGRSAQQLGALMGAYSAFVGEMDDALLQQVVKHRTEMRDEQSEDYTECLDLLLGISVSTTEGPMNVSQMIAKNMEQDLARIGVRVDGDNLDVWVNSQEIARNMPVKYRNYASALLKLDGSVKANKRIGHTQRKSVVVRGVSRLVVRGDLNSV